MADELPRPKRRLKVFDVVCLGINGIVGSGIFLYPSELSRLLGGASPLAFLLAAVSAALIGLCLAELGGRIDRTGGPQAYAYEGFGSHAGFAVGWLNYPAFVTAFAAVARGVGGYASRVLPFAGTPAGEASVAVSIVVVLTSINYVGIRPAAWVTDFFTVGKLIPLVLLAAVGLSFADWHRFQWTDAPTANWGRAWFACMFAMGGFENVGVPAGETENPRRAVPIAILASIGGAALVYVAVQAAAYGVLPGIGSSTSPLSDAAYAVMGPAGALLLTAGAAVSMIGFTSGSAILTPRALVALSESNDLPGVLAGRHPRFGTPHRSILVTGAVAAVLAALLGFGSLADFGLFATLLCYSISCAALLRVRKRTDLPPAPFRVPAAPVVVALAVGVSLVLATQAGWRDATLAFGLLAGGFAVRAVVRALR